MTKEGEGHHPPKIPNISTFSQELERHCAKFLHSLERYEETADWIEKEHLKGVMDEELKQIGATAEEISHHGVHKQKVKVEKDYQNYLRLRGKDSYSALFHDLQTLKDFTEITKKLP